MVPLMTCLMRMKLNQIIQESNMATQTRSNEIVFKSYQEVINRKLKAGKDVSNLTRRLNQLISRFKNK
mgnify:FL=1